jgi:membrane fusion protein (multidrug efflux system)
MAKKFILTVLGLLVVVGGLVGVKVLQFKTMFAQSAKAAAPPESVATSPVSETSLNPTLDAVGSVVAVQGVTLNAEITGTIRRIAFESGAKVQSGAVPVELDTSVEKAQLEAASAGRDLASINLESGRSLVDSGAIAVAQWVSLQAQANQAEAELNAVKLSGVATMPLDQALSFLEGKAKEIMPPVTCWISPASHVSCAPRATRSCSRLVWPWC